MESISATWRKELREEVKWVYKVLIEVAGLKQTHKSGVPTCKRLSLMKPYMD